MRGSVHQQKKMYFLQPEKDHKNVLAFCIEMRGVRNEVPCEIRLSREFVFSSFLYDALVGMEFCFKRVLLY